MSKLARIGIACALIVMALAPAAQAQVTLLSPPNGADLDSPPVFEWTDGGYDVFYFYTAFYYEVPGYSGYYPTGFWMLNTFFSMPTSWWDVVGPDTTSYWAVYGYNTNTQTGAVSAVASFTKVGCTGQCAGQYTGDCDPSAPCLCFTSTEGEGHCTDDFYCDNWPSCSSSAECGAGLVCITCSYCDGNRCAPDQCTDGGPYRLDGSGPTAGGE